MSVTFRRRSGATLSATWQQLTLPIGLQALHFDGATDTYERLVDGGEIVSIKRIDRSQVILVGHDGRLANFSADGIMGLSQLRRLATMHP
jgi:hypothetical protein